MDRTNLEYLSERSTFNSVPVLQTAKVLQDVKQTNSICLHTPTDLLEVESFPSVGIMISNWLDDLC